MILTESKPLDEILSGIGTDKSIFIIGCNVCAAKMHTGGEPEIDAMTCALSDHGYKVLGSILPTAACSIRSYDSLVERNENIKNADVVFVMACGSGVSTVASVVPVPAVSTTNTLSLGGRADNEILDNLCKMCGTCNSQIYGGLCPNTGCPKSQLNGPCGGSKNGKCEVDENKDCIWDRIQQKFKEQPAAYTEFVPPKEHQA